MVQSTGRWNLRWCSKPQRVVHCSLETMITYSTVLPQHYRIQTIPNSCHTLRRTPISLHRHSTAFPPRRRSLPRTFAAGISVPFLRAVRWRSWVGRLGTLVFRRRKCFRPRPRNVESMGVRRYPRRALARTPCKSTGKYKRPLSRRAVGQRTEHRMERNAHNEVDVSRSSGHGRSILLCSNPADDDLMGPIAFRRQSSRRSTGAPFVVTGRPRRVTLTPDSVYYSAPWLAALSRIDEAPSIAQKLYRAAAPSWGTTQIL